MKVRRCKEGREERKMVERVMVGDLCDSRSSALSNKL